MSEFAGKSVVVTGSNSGIGESTAILFASRGANLTVCGRDETRLQQVVGKCRKAAQDAGFSTTKVISVAGDLTSGGVRAETISQTVEAFGGIDVLIANHGVANYTPSLDTVTEEIFDSQMDINVRSVLFLVKAAVEHLQKSQGCVVVTSSIISTLASGRNISYFMSKAAVDQMVRCLAVSLAPKGIRINAVNPTLIDTRIFRHLETTPLGTELGQFFQSTQPLPGGLPRPEDVAQAILYLSSTAGARFVTGQCLKVDGATSLIGYPPNFYTPPTQDKTSGQ